MNEAIGMALWLVFASLCFGWAAWCAPRAVHKVLFAIPAVATVGVTIAYLAKLLA